ncbi:MAG: hypothetical protein ACHQWU_07440 [Gemmatimonadales bacterium]
MRYFKLSICLIALALARPLVAQAVPASRFIPLVPVPSDTTAKCEAANPVVLQPGDSGVLLRFATHDGVGRVVSAVWDSAGHLRRYNDARGDLRGPPNPIAARGPRTTITIEVAMGMALLVNEDHGRTPGSLMSTVNDALAADNLGPPRKLLARLHTQCGAPITPLR